MWPKTASAYWRLLKRRLDCGGVASFVLSARKAAPMKPSSFVAVVIAFLGLVGNARAQLDPKQPLQGTKSDPVTYDIDFSAVVTAPYHTKTLKVWLALPQSDVAQTIE